MCSSTGRPASRSCPTSVGTSSRPGCGASGSFASPRSMPSSRRISVSAPRPLCSTVSSTSRVEAFASPSTRRSAPAWRTIIETWWAITSCSSRAIRARSSTTASRAATSRSRSAIRARRSRSPITRRTSSITTTVTTVNGTALRRLPFGPALAARSTATISRRSRARSGAAASRPRARTARRRSRPARRGSAGRPKRVLHAAEHRHRRTHERRVAAANGDRRRDRRRDERNPEPMEGASLPSQISSWAMTGEHGRDQPIEPQRIGPESTRAGRG